MSRRDPYDYNFGMSDGDWGMGYGSKNKAEYVKAPQETRWLLTYKFPVMSLTLYNEPLLSLRYSFLRCILCNQKNLLYIDLKQIIDFLGTTTLAWVMAIGAWVGVAESTQNMSAKSKGV